MKKNNIFSREYERKIRRRRFIILFITLVILIISVFYIINFSKINNYLRDKYYFIISREIANYDPVQDKQDVDSIIEEELTPSINDVNISNDDVLVENIESESLVHKVNLNNVEIDVFYKVESNGIEYLGISENLLSEYSFDISPNKKRILTENNHSQDTYMLDDSFNVFKLDPEFFYSKSANNRFYKSDIIGMYEGYSWYKDAKFLDDNTIIYISNLPWFGKNEEYIWRTDISDVNNISHFMTSVGGQNIDLGELTEQGIKVNINNEMKLLTFSFVLN